MNYKSNSKTPIVCCDNLSTVHLVANPVLRACNNHIDLDLYFVREKVIQKKIEIRHVPSIDQIAYVFTKAVSSSSFGHMTSKLRVENFSLLSLRGEVRNKVS